MFRELDGGSVFTVAEITATEYAPHRGVWVAQLLGRARGDGVGLYHGRIEPGCGIDGELHPGSSKVIYLLKGQALARVRDEEVVLAAGDVLHVEAGVPHSFKNTGAGYVEYLVIAHPDV